MSFSRCTLPLVRNTRSPKPSLIPRSHVRAGLAHPTQADAAPEDSVINILVASDLHLGYLEKDPIRGEDSFVTFNEVFQIANERKVQRRLLRPALTLP